MTERLLAVLQFADGLFPSGGFAHSFGLETYAQTGAVRDAAGVAELIRAQLEGSAGPADAVAAACSARRARAGDLAGCVEIDRRLDAMKWVPEFRAASLQMGRQTARVADSIGDAFMGPLARAIDEGGTPGHHAVVFGAALGRHDADPELVAAAYLHSTATLLVNAALRLVAFGQLEGQRMLAALRPLIARLAHEATRAELDEMWSFTPALEIAGVRHAELDARMFRS
jgi:urease accessory protein